MRERRKKRELAGELNRSTMRELGVGQQAGSTEQIGDEGVGQQAEG